MRPLAVARFCGSNLCPFPLSTTQALQVKNQAKLPEEMTLAELRALVALEDSPLLNQIRRQSGLIFGGSSFWASGLVHLEKGIADNHPPTVYFTLSFADHHWPVLHALLAQYAGDTTGTTWQEHADPQGSPALAARRALNVKNFPVFAGALSFSPALSEPISFSSAVFAQISTLRWLRGCMWRFGRRPC